MVQRSQKDFARHLLLPFRPFHPHAQFPSLAVNTLISPMSRWVVQSKIYFRNSFFVFSVRNFPL